MSEFKNNKKYSDLHELLEMDYEAAQYFNTLPEFVRETIMQSKNDITGMTELKDCANNICRSSMG